MKAIASNARFGWRLAGTAGFVAALALGSGAALAQKKKSEPAKAPQSAWVKLCEKAPVMIQDKSGKPQRSEKNICLTHHERLDGNTGMVLVSAAVRDVEGQNKRYMMVMVPLGMAIQPGLRAKIYDADMWAKAQKNEKVDDSKIESIKLRFSLCHPAGCTAEMELKDDLLAKLKAGAGMMVFSINANGQVIAFPVPLTGFSAALAGPPIDNKKYSEARKALMKQIAMRQQHMMEEYKKKQAAQQGATQKK
ncbi:MAG: invasion associated locus B family protein [Hyphomicrobiaceae bacterium]